MVKFFCVLPFIVILCCTVSGKLRRGARPYFSLPVDSIPTDLIDLGSGVTGSEADEGKSLYYSNADSLVPKCLGKYHWLAPP